MAEPPFPKREILGDTLQAQDVASLRREVGVLRAEVAALSALLDQTREKLADTNRRLALVSNEMAQMQKLRDDAVKILDWLCSTAGVILDELCRAAEALGLNHLVQQFKESALNLRQKLSEAVTK